MQNHFPSGSEDLSPSRVSVLRFGCPFGCQRLFSLLFSTPVLVTPAQLAFGVNGMVSGIWTNSEFFLSFLVLFFFLVSILLLELLQLLSMSESFDRCIAPEQLS